MKRVFKIIVVAAMLGLGFSAKGSSPLQWLNTRHDFGAFREDDGKVRCTFRVVNRDSGDISIRAARASCGCTAPSYPKGAISPGDTASIEVVFNPVGRPGRFTKTVSIDIASPTPSPRQTLTITGVVIGSQNTLRSRYPVEAGRMKLRGNQVPFGSIVRGRAKSAFVEVYNASESEIQPVWLEKPDYIKLTPSCNEGVILPGEQCVYTLLFTTPPSAPYGVVTDSVLITLPGQEPLKLDLTAIVEEDFSRLTPSQREKAPQMVVETPRVDFGRVDRNARGLEMPLRVRNAGKSPLEIRRIYTLDRGVEIVQPKKFTVKPGKGIDIMLRFHPEELDEEGDLLNARVMVIANDPENATASVRVTAEIEGKQQ